MSCSALSPKRALDRDHYRPRRAEDARWFPRDWLLPRADDDSFRLPCFASITRRLAEDWLRGR
jgi:hypothetical protein